MVSFNSAETRVIPNTHGFTLTELAGLQVNPISTGETIHFLYLGRLEKVKGVDFFCQAIKNCVSKNWKIHLHVAGWGSQEASLRQHYDSMPWVTFHGAAYGAEKSSLISNCDYLVVPSLYPEIFGVVITEAYAYGKPVIASRVGGIPELVDDGVTGFLFDAGNSKQIEEIILKAAAKQFDLRMMAEACYLAAKKYTTESVTRQYMQLYQSNGKMA